MFGEAENERQINNSGKVTVKHTEQNSESVKNQSYRTELQRETVRSIATENEVEEFQEGVVLILSVQFGRRKSAEPLGSFPGSRSRF